MKAFSPLFLVLACFSGLLAQEKDQAFLLASKNPPLPVDEVFKVTHQDSLTDAPIEIRLQDRVLKGRMTMGSKKVVEYSFLGKDRIRATVLHDRHGGSRVLAGNEDLLDEIEPTEGRSFVLSKQDGSWMVKPEDAEIAPGDQEAIDEMMETLGNQFGRKVEEDLAIYGEKPRQVGETWEVKGTGLPGMEDFEILDGKIEVTFLKVEEFQGEPCAVLKMKFKLAGLANEDEMEGVGGELQGSATVTRSLAHFLDYRVEAKMGMKFSGPLEVQAGMKANLKIEGDVQLEMTALRQEAEIAWNTTKPKEWQEIGFGGEGSAQWKDGVLQLDAGVELTGTKYTGEKLPEMPYELQLEARKVAGADFFCGLTFPVSSKKECLTFIVGGWGGGTVGISSIDGLDASENETTTYGNFEVDQWYAIRLMVEEDRLRAFIDGEKVVDLATKGRQLALRPGVIESCAPLGLASWQTAAEVRKFRWRSLAD